MLSKRFLILSILMVFSAAAGIVEYIYPKVESYVYLEIIGLILLLAYLRQLHLKCPAYFYTSFYQIYSIVGLVISLLFIGFGIPMLEIDKVGNSNGSFWLLLLFLLIGLESGNFGYQKTRYIKLFPTKMVGVNNQNRIVFVLSSTILLVGLFILFVYSSPFFLGVTRVNFWSNIVNDWFRLYPSLLGQTFFLAAFIYLRARVHAQKNKFALILVILYVFSTVVVVGEKFSTFIFYISGWLVLCAGFYKGVVVNGKHLTIGVVIVSLLLVFISLTYVASGKEVFFVFYRIAMQGQIIWSVLDDREISLLIGEPESCFFTCDQWKSGTDYISARYLPANLWESYQATGSGLTGFMPALPILAYGLPLAIVLHVLFSFLSGCFQSTLVLRVKSGDLILSLLFFKIYIGLLVFWYASRPAALGGVLVTCVFVFLWILIFPSRSNLFKTNGHES